MRNSFRFYKRFKLAPGLSLGVSKSGLSLGAGVRGAHVSLGRGGLRTTESLPGTGLSASQAWGRHGRRRSAHGIGGSICGLGFLLGFLWFTGVDLRLIAGGVIAILILSVIVSLLRNRKQNPNAPMPDRIAELKAIGERIETLSREAQPLARIVDTEPRNSVNWKQAAVELCRLTAESLELARALGEPEILEIAESAAAKVRTNCPLEAEAVGL
jgi:hypothetical protein